MVTVVLCSGGDENGNEYLTGKKKKIKKKIHDKNNSLFSIIFAFTKFNSLKVTKSMRQTLYISSTYLIWTQH